ncbi:MAG: NAD(P)-binding domain-containing protein [Polyangiales bacterium]
MTKHIAILGAGRMGSVFAKTLRAQGHGVGIWNRTAARAEPLRAAGVQVAGSIPELVGKAEVVISILSDYQTTRSLLSAAEIAGALRGKTWIQLASGTPAEARAAAAWARENNVRYLDGAIMAPPELIGQAGCTILYAGERALFEAQREWLVQLAGRSVHAGDDVGHAAALDSALLTYYWGALFGTLQGYAVSHAEGIDANAYREHVTALLPVVDGSVLELLDRAARRHFDDTSATVDTHHDALLHLQAICEQRGLDQRIPAAFTALLADARRRGDGQRDFAAVLRSLLP